MTNVMVTVNERARLSGSGSKGKTAGKFKERNHYVMEKDEPRYPRGHRCEPDSGSMYDVRTLINTDAKTKH